jgi:hypothetical protein
MDPPVAPGHRGCGSDGRTGLRALMRGPRGAKRALKCYVSTPSLIEALEGRRVLHATTGRYWSLAVVSPQRDLKANIEPGPEPEPEPEPGPEPEPEPEPAHPQSH